MDHSGASCNRTSGSVYAILLQLFVSRLWELMVWLMGLRLENDSIAFLHSENQMEFDLDSVSAFWAWRR